jgi:hypothetical protein
MVASADFGLAPYRPTPKNIWSGKNIYQMGYSSGKVSYYALCGLPIIATDLPVYRRIFQEYDCGRIYRSTSSIIDLMLELDQNYEFHSSESKRFYHEQLNPVEAVNQFCDRLQIIANV